MKQQSTIHTEALRASSTLKCLNLRPRDGQLHAVGQPQIVAPAGHKLLLHFSTPDGLRLLTHTNRTLYLSDATGTVPAAVATCAATPLCAVFASGRIAVMTDGGPELFDYPSFARLGSDAAAGAGVALRAVAGPRTLMAQVARRTLSADYRQASTLSAADERLVSADLRAAYDTLCVEARSQGMMMQPALARYRLLDASGSVLFVSPPVLLGTTNCAAAVRLKQSSDMAVEPYTLQADTWRLQLDMPADMPSDVRSVQVCLSPQFQPVDSSKAATVRVAVQSSQTIVSASLAPTTVGIHSGGTAAAAHTVRECMARMDSLERVVATVPAAPGTAVELECAPVLSAAAETAALETALRRNVSQISAAEARMLAPHSFTARCGATAGRSLVWADVQTRLYAGYPLPMFAAATSAQPWSAYVAVDMADGSRAVWQGEGTTGAPQTLHPVLAYPAPDAVRMTIGLRVGTAMPQVRSFALEPVAGGCMAAYVDPSCAPFALDGSTVTSLAPPDPLVEATRNRSALIAADTSAPLVALATGEANGAIVALHAAEARSGSWEFGRTRFLAFGHGGIDSVTLSASRTVLATSRLDRRSVSSAAAVAMAGGGTCYALAGSDLLRIGATGAPAALLHGTAFTALAYDCTADELWCFNPEGSVEVLCTGCSPLRSYMRGAVTLQTAVSDANAAFLQTPGGILALHCQAADAAVYVAWEGFADIACAGRSSPVRGVRLHAAGTGVNARLGVAAASQLAAEPTAGADWRIVGTVSGPLQAGVVMRRASRVHVSFEGTVDAGFKLSEIQLL